MLPLYIIASSQQVLYSLVSLSLSIYLNYSGRYFSIQMYIYRTNIFFLSYYLKGNKRTCWNYIRHRIKSCCRIRRVSHKSLLYIQTARTKEKFKTVLGRPNNSTFLSRNNSIQTLVPQNSFGAMLLLLYTLYLYICIYDCIVSALMGCFDRYNSLAHWVCPSALIKYNLCGLLLSIYRETRFDVSLGIVTFL